MLTNCIDLICTFIDYRARCTLEWQWLSGALTSDDMKVCRYRMMTYPPESDNKVAQVTVMFRSQQARLPFISLIH